MVEFEPEPFFEPRTSHEPAAPQPGGGGPRPIPNWGRFEPVFEPEAPAAKAQPAEPRAMPLRFSDAPLPPVAVPVEAAPAAAPAPAAVPQAPAKDDLEIPAFLRRERKLFQ